MLTARQLFANDLLRKRNVFNVAVRVLVETRDSDGLRSYALADAILGPRIDSQFVWVKRDGQPKEVVEIGQVLVGADTAQRLETAVAQSEAEMRAHYAKQAERMVAETAAKRAVGLSPFQNVRGSGGKFAGRYGARV